MTGNPKSSVPGIRVSVIVPCYNREKLLRATLDSVRQQSFPDWETIIIDDHSEDRSFEVAQSYARADHRFQARLREGSRKGGNICRNQGLAAARGDYIVFLDSDDLLANTCLERRIAAMDQAADCSFGVFQTELFTEQIGDRKVIWNAYTATDDLHRFLSLDTVWQTAGPIWTKQALVRLGGFDEDLPSFQDWDLHVRALISGIKYFKQPVRDNYYRYGYHNGAAICEVSLTHPNHLRSHERLFTKILVRLQTARLLDAECRARVAGLFWWMAKCWRNIGSIPDADRVWRTAHDLGLCNHRRYLEGRMIFRLYSARRGGRFAALVQFLLQPRHYRTQSEFFHNAPMPEENPPIQAGGTTETQPRRGLVAR